MAKWTWGTFGSQVGALAAAGLLVVGCGMSAKKGVPAAPPQSPNGTAVDVSKKETLKVAYSASTPNLQDIQLYVAQEKGIYAKYGLTVEISRINGVAPTFQAVISGDADAGFLDPTQLLSSREKAQDLKGIVNTSPTQPYMLLARSSVKDLQDLNGKRIGISQPGTLSQTIIRLAMEKHGVTEKGIQWIAVGGSGPRYKGLVSDRIDAGIVQVSHSLQGAKEKEPLKVIADLGKELPDLMGYLYVAKQSTIDGKRSAMIKFVAANLEATQLVLQDKDLATDTYMKYNTGVTKENALQEYDILKSSGAWNPEGNLRPAAVSFTADMMLKDGTLKAAPTGEKFFAEDILNAAKDAMKQVGSHG
jgi:NitT/TauT family transport system substrate-binding protein